MPTSPIRVALDAMGSDHGVEVVVAGAAALSREERPVRVLLVGDSARIGAALSRERYDPA